ncbi:DUF4011 domain-containing protein [Stappia sp.]|uniref:DUF4011 domain-containing protein n=1 Tax=Stappia sp. TaxID=1870903 RepID=UPI0032D91974
MCADIASSFTYASYQNAIPVIRSLAIENGSDRQVDDLRLELTSSPAFLRPKTWTVDRVRADDSLAMSDRTLDLDAAYLDGLNEAERGEITLRLSAAGKLLDERRLPVRLLARDEWGGVEDMAQLLPAFILPNDPGIPPVLRAAAERLVAHGHSGALDGYQSQSPQRAFMLAAAIYAAIAKQGLHYAEPPASFETRGQKIRRPATIAEARLATCLDTALLFAAALEAAGLHPFVLLFDGHAASGVWLQERSFARSIETDPMEVRKALAAREAIVFETTGVTHRPAMTFEAAQHLLAPRLGEDRAKDFVAAVDIRRSRSAGITPLASHDALRRRLPEGEEEQAPVSDLPLPAMPAFAELPPETAEEKPTTAAGRIERWQRKLLDLTLRNRLLNFPESKKTIPFLCGDVARLEDRLAEGVAIRIVSLPEQNPLGERDAALYRDVHGKDLQRTFAAEALARDELTSTLDARQLEARLIDLYRQVRNDYAEGGANTLFLAVGFLRWKKQASDERSYRAPLLLIPVKLERRSASSRFSLRYHEDEPRFNATLLQFLERDFDLALTGFDGELPTDDSGVDVPRVLSMVRHAVRDVPGMEVVDETALSTFSFAKFLMWKDLVERTDDLRRNRVVRHLIDTPDQAFGPEASGAPVRDEGDLDRSCDPADIVNILPADSSQIAASVAAADGHDFVVVGPPGTGKSQTIANMISNCLAAGKTVLFVAEKTAALDVVYRRLREHGLGPHCVELHSSKTDRRHFLGQLKSAWEEGGAADLDEWIEINERLRLRRDELNAYVEALHRRHANGWSPFMALGLALHKAEMPAPELAWSERETRDAEALRALEDLAENLGHVFASVERRPGLELVDLESWSSGAQDAVLAAAQALADAIETGLAELSAFRESLGLEGERRASADEVAPLKRLAGALCRCEGLDVSIAFDRDLPDCERALTRLAADVDAYRNEEAALSASYAPVSVRDLDTGSLDGRWREAVASLWPMSMLGKRKVARLLQGYAEAGRANPETDLPVLRRMQDILARIADSPLAGKRVPFEGLTTDLEALGEVLGAAREVREALTLPERDADALRPVLQAVAPCLGAGEEGGALRGAARALLRALEDLDAARGRFDEAAARPVEEVDEDRSLEALKGRLVDLMNARHLLRDWSSWCKVRRQARVYALDALVAGLESGIIPARDAREAFRVGYARWWLPKVLDGDPILRDFRRFQHENTLEQFRHLDEMVQAHAARRVALSVAHGLPSVQSVPRKSELGQLRHQMQLKRPSRSIRDMIASMPETFPRLAPCMLMSPLSIAQYLPANQSLFDVVIFDEASQITTWDAVGAIARARQTIIVGDPKQLPPTNFFGRNEEDEEIADHEKDLESILDEATAAGIPVRDLRWHYRSRSESLIAFSNHHYYNNRLVTFPSPTVEDRAVHLRQVSDGVYDRGKSRTNRIEAEAVVRDAVARMTGWLDLPEEDRPTLGVITFNAQQQSLIMDLLDAARRDAPDLEWFFADDRVEPTIVKNLENVQGDERDVILFSITYWKDAAGKLTMDFGAINRDGGERRLNVAVTRARRELVVFSGFTADMIDTGRAKGLAVRHLKAFLDYAERGAVALPAQDIGSVGGFDSPFEEAVADELQRRGWLVVPQVGVSGFRVDMGVRNPDRPGAYLAGVECDGATYHGSATARDRDKVRQQVLAGLGWSILRVWSTDWWFDAPGCAERLHADLCRLLEESRVEESRVEDSRA